MKSIEYLKMQVDIYSGCAQKVEQKMDELRQKQEEAQVEYDVYKKKFDEFKSLLDMVEYDFKEYGWNPAG